MLEILFAKFLRFYHLSVVRGKDVGGRSTFLKLWRHLRVEKLSESQRLASRHFSSRRERNRGEYPWLKLLPPMNFLLKKIRHRLLTSYTPRAICPSQEADFLSTSACTWKKLIAVRRKLMHPSVRVLSRSCATVRRCFELLRNCTNDNLQIVTNCATRCSCLVRVYDTMPENTNDEILLEGITLYLEENPTCVHLLFQAELFVPG